MKRYQVILLVATLFFLVGWSAKSFFVTYTGKENHLPTQLEQIIAKKRLDVVILNAPTVYYVGPHRKMGFEYDLIASYAKSIGVDLNLSVVHTINEALELSRMGIGDITVASLTQTPEREREFIFGPQYYIIQEQVICHQDMYRTNKFPRDVNDLTGLNIMVGEETSYVNTLQKLQENNISVHFTTTDTYSTQQLLAKVWKKEIDCTIADSNTFMLNQRYYPELRRAFVISDRKNLAWILRKGDTSLSKSLYAWLNTFERSGTMAELRDTYYAFLNIFDYYDTKIFHKRLKARLPKYQHLFKQAGEKYNIPWELLAAQSYQESHWNPKAKSHTGVRGMMMLTLATAKQVGIKNRLDAKQSIFGGAKYFASIEKRFSNKVKGSNRFAFTLAAYNVGMGHLHDAQTLARKLNKNPYAWSDIKTVLPLLSEKKYYKNLKYGYARGNEPVRYIESIQHYVDLIIQSEHQPK